MSSSIRVKIFFRDQARRFKVSSDVNLTELCASLLSMFPFENSWGLCYLDDEGDWVNVVVESDWEEAVDGYCSSGQSLLKLRIQENPKEELSLSVDEKADPTVVVETRPTSPYSKTQCEQQQQRPEPQLRPTNETSRPKTIAETCDELAKQMREAGSAFHLSVKVDCDRTIFDTLKHCNAIYAKEREETAKEKVASASPDVFESVRHQCDEAVRSVSSRNVSQKIDEIEQPTVPVFEVNFNAEEFISRLGKLSLDVAESCGSLSEKAVDDAMKL